MRKHQEVYDSTVKLMLMITCLTLSHSNLNQVLQIILITKKCFVNVIITVPLEYLSNLWKTLEMPLTNCKVNLMLNWSVDCVIFEAGRATSFAITDTKLCVPVVTISTQDSTKLLKQLKLAFKITTNWNKSQSKASTQAQNQYLVYLTDPIFQGINRPFVL